MTAAQCALPVSRGSPTTPAVCPVLPIAGAKVRIETVWKVLGGRDGGLRFAPWRAGDTLQICPTTNGVASVRIFPSPQGGDVLGCTPYGRSSTPSSTS
jgi:hypothetical protein